MSDRKRMVRVSSAFSQGEFDWKDPEFLTPAHWADDVSDELMP